MKYFSSTFFLVCLMSTLLAQSSGSLFLKWKIKSGEVLKYKSTIDEIDTGSASINSFQGFLNMLCDSSAKENKEAENIFCKINTLLKNSTLISELSEQKKGIINIEMHLDKRETVPDTTQDTIGLRTVLSNMMEGVQLRGSITEDGTISSFYVKNDQRNLIALLFELPGKEVKVGDVWGLDVHLISIDQNFTCDSSYRKNRVRLEEIKKEGSETIVVIKYDIDEYIEGNYTMPSFTTIGNEKTGKTKMKMTYNAIAEFSIEQGRWISYDGILSLKSSGALNSNSTKKISLVATQ